MSLSRRQFVQSAGVAGVGLLAGCGIGAPLTQPRAHIPRVGVLRTSPSSGLSATDPLRLGLADLGYVDGQPIHFELRSSQGREGQLPRLAEELVRIPVDVIVTAGEPPIRAARQATGTIPIVMATSRDPVTSGLISSLARPGGNITGASQLSDLLARKRLELLKQTVPHLSLVGALGSPTSVSEFKETEVAADMLGVRLQRLEVHGPEGFDGAFELVAQERVQALTILSSPPTIGRHTQLAQLTTARQLPAVSHDSRFAQVGGLLAYGPNIEEMWRRAAYFVDRILRGAKPADLPVEQPMTFDFVVNMKTAAALGITFPNEIMLQVTEVIE